MFLAQPVVVDIYVPKARLQLRKLLGHKSDRLLVVAFNGSTWRIELDA
jgi:hypothetical protein